MCCTKNPALFDGELPARGEAVTGSYIGSFGVYCMTLY